MAAIESYPLYYYATIQTAPSSPAYTLAFAFSTISPPAHRLPVADAHRQRHVRGARRDGAGHQHDRAGVLAHDTAEAAGELLWHWIHQDARPRAPRPRPVRHHRLRCVGVVSARTPMWRPDDDLVVYTASNISNPFTIQYICDPRLQG